MSGQEMSRHGVHADRVNVPAQCLLPRLATADAIAGAALWTAYGVLAEVGRVRPGDAVVITAASSSVGLAAIQVANHLGAVPIAVTRTAAKSARVLQAGAAHVIVTADEGDLLGQVHAVTGGRGRGSSSTLSGGLSELAETVAADGLLIVYGWLDLRPAPLPLNWPRTVHGFDLALITADPDRLDRAFADGTLKPVIDRTFDPGRHRGGSPPSGVQRPGRQDRRHGPALTDPWLEVRTSGSGLCSASCSGA